MMETTRPSPWPRATNELLPHTLFKLAAQYPSATYAEFPVNPSNIEDGYRKITYAEVANAVNSFAWWVEENVGKLREEEQNGTQTLVYMGPNDIRYAVLCLGSVIAGYKVCCFPTRASRWLKTWLTTRTDDFPISAIRSGSSGQTDRGRGRKGHADTRNTDTGRGRNCFIERHEDDADTECRTASHLGFEALSIQQDV
jgi:hypothetical protein